MKLIFLNRFYYPDYSATSQILSDLAFFLAGENHEVHVVTSRQRYDDAGAGLPADETVAGVRVHRVWTTSFGRGFLPGRALDYLSFYLAAGWRLWRLARRDDVVIAKTDPPLISLVAAVVVRRRGARLVNWLQDLFPEVAVALDIRIMQGALGRWLQRRRNASLYRAVSNVVLGERMAARLRDEGIDDERIRSIPNWADGDAIRPLDIDANPLRAEWGLRDRFVVGYSGNLGRAHEFETLLGAMELLRPHPNPSPGGRGARVVDGDSQQDIVFLFIGGGHQRDLLEAEAARRGLSNILFRPYQPRERLRESLGVADVHLVSLRPELEGLIVPSKYYGIAAAGRPAIMIGDPEGELGGIVRQHDCGMAVAEGDSGGLAAAIRDYRDDSALRERHGRNARALFERCYDKKIAMGKWEKLIVGLLVR